MKTVLTLIVVPLLLAGGCAARAGKAGQPSAPDKASSSPARPGGVQRLDKPTTPLAEGDQASTSTGVRQRLELARALELAEARHPDLRAAQSAIGQAEGRAMTVAKFPQPELYGRVESYPVRGNGASQAEYLAGVSQAVPLGRRLSLAEKAELQERDKARHELESVRRDLRARVQQAYANAHYWQHAEAVWRDGQALAHKGAELAKARVEAGETIPAEAAQAQNELLRAGLEVEKARLQRHQSFSALATALGDPGLRIESLADPEASLPSSTPALGNLLAKLDQHPQLAAAEAQVASRRTRVALAREGRKPDLNFELGWRRMGEEGNGFDAGFSIPIPSRNKGPIREAEAALAEAEARAQGLRNELELKIREAHGKLTRAIASANLLQKEILPKARQVLETAETRYQAGDISLTELLPLRRDTIALQLSHQEALRELMEAWANIAPYLEADEERQGRP